jgi:outer membrane murein-binding lipoprotein Lpp
MPWKTRRQDLKMLTNAEDCALIGKLATDVRKRDLFDRLATDLRAMASDVQAMMALKRAERDGDIKKPQPE